MARLVVREGRNVGAEYSIPQGKTVVILGRALASDVRVVDPQASRSHVEILRDGRRFMIRDLGSANGTYVRNMKLKGTIELRPEARFRIGGTVYEFLAEPGEVPGRALALRADALEIIPPEALAQQKKMADAIVASGQQVVPVDGATPLPTQMKAVNPPPAHRPPATPGEGSGRP